MDPGISAAFADQGLTLVDEGGGTPPKPDAGAASGADGSDGSGGSGAGADRGGSEGSEHPFIADGKFKEDVFIQTVFGEKSTFKSLSDLKTIPDIIKNSENYKIQLADLSEKLKIKTNPFTNQTIAKINILAKETGIEDVNFLSRLAALDLDKVDSKTLIKLSMIKDNPNFAAKEALVDKTIDKKYNFSAIDSNEEMDEVEKASEKELLQFAMDTEANKIRREFSEMLGKAVIPTQEEIAAKESAAMAQAREGWSPVVDEIKKSFASLKVPAGKFTVDFDVPKETLEKAVKATIDFASKQYGGDITQSNAKQLVNYLQAIVKIAEEANINNRIMEYGRNLSEKEWIEQVNNPSQFNKDQKPAGKGAGKDADQALFDFFAKR